MCICPAQGLWERGLLLPLQYMQWWGFSEAVSANTLMGIWKQTSCLVSPVRASSTSRLWGTA